MTIRVVQCTKPSPLAELTTQYLLHCRAGGLMPKTLKQYRYSIDSVFRPWCEEQGITNIAQLDQHQLDAFTVMLHDHRTAAGKPLSRSPIRTYIRPVGLMLTWAKKAGEEVRAKPQMPRRERQLRDVLSRDELALLEDATPAERDKLIVRIFADCGLRLTELTQLNADGITKRVYPHLLRHAWMTELLRNGLSADQISPIAGASPAVISECDAHLNVADGYDAMMGALSARIRR